MVITTENDKVSNADEIKEVHRENFIGEIDFSQYKRAIKDPEGDNNRKFILEHNED